MNKGLIYFTSKDTDSIIARHVITSGKPSAASRLNAVFILFGSTHNGFAILCWQRYLYLMGRYLHDSVFNLPNYRLNKGQFWTQTIQRFKLREEPVMVFKEHKGNVRKRLYMLSIVYGYSHVNYGQKSDVLFGRRRITLYNKETGQRGIPWNTSCVIVFKKIQ